MNRPAQPPYTQEVKKLRDEAECEILFGKLQTANQIVFKTMRDGTVLKFKRLGQSQVVTYHIYYETDQQEPVRLILFIVPNNSPNANSQPIEALVDYDEYAKTKGSSFKMATHLLQQYVPKDYHIVKYEVA